MQQSQEEIVGLDRDRAGARSPVVDLTTADPSLQLLTPIKWRPLCFNPEWENSGYCHCPRDRSFRFPDNCRDCHYRYKG